jgi:hypothetical protein
MIDDPVKTEEFNNIRIEVYYDEGADNPRDTYETLGTLVEWHRRMDFGDQKAPRNLEDEWSVLEFFGVDDDDVFLPVYMYQHGHATISVNPFGDRWDSGQVGWIFAKKDRYTNYGYSREDAKKELIREVEELDTYIRGDYYFIEIIELDKCEHCGKITETVLEAYGQLTAEDVEIIIEEEKQKMKEED